MSKKLGAVAILLIIVLLIVAAFRLQMELNELRDEAEELTQQLNEARLEKEKVERDYDMMRKNLDEYLEKEALEHGYRYPNTKEFTNDMAEN